MSITLGEEGQKALKYFKENLAGLSTPDLHLITLINEILMKLMDYEAEMKEYEKIMEELEPLIAKELEFRSRDTQGTV